MVLAEMVWQRSEHFLGPGCVNRRAGRKKCKGLWRLPRSIERFDARTGTLLEDRAHD